MTDPVRSSLFHIIFVRVLKFSCGRPRPLLLNLTGPCRSIPGTYDHQSTISQIDVHDVDIRRQTTERSKKRQKNHILVE